MKIKKGEKEWLLIKERDELGLDRPRAAGRVGAVAGSRWRTSRRGATAAEAIRARARSSSARRAGRSRRRRRARCWRRPPSGRSRGRAGCSSPSSTAIGFSPRVGAGTPRLLTRNGNDCSRGVSRGHARGRRAAVRPRAARRRGRGAGRRRTPELSAAAGPGPPAAADRHPARGGRDARSPTTPSTCSGSRTSICVRCRSPTRKALLQRVLPPLGALRYLEHVEEDGEALYREAERLGLEGVVAKKADRAYKAGALARLAQDPRPAGPATSWWSASRRPRARAAGSARCTSAEYVNGTLTYAGRVGSGFTEKQLGEVTPRARGAAPRRSAVRRARAEGEGDDVGRAPTGVPRSSTPSGRRRGCCGSRCSCGSATTSGRRSASGRREVGRSDDAMAPGRTARGARTMAAGGRGGRDGREGPAPGAHARAPGTRRRRASLRAHQPQEGLLARGRATPRATSSTTTARSRPGCCRICGIGRW